MDGVVYSVERHETGWAVRADGVPVLTMKNRGEAVALAEEANRLLRGGEPPEGIASVLGRCSRQELRSPK